MLLNPLNTKYKTNFQRGGAAKKYQVKANFCVNNAKSFKLSVNISLRRLRVTDYINILYANLWNFNTSIEGVMNQPHNLVTPRTVLYLGISDSPALVVALINQYVHDHRETPFVIYQEREMSWNAVSGGMVFR